MKKPPPKTYNVHEAKTHLSRLLEQVAAGEDVVIAKAGVPVARLVPVILPTGERPLGTEQGRISVADDFDAPLPHDILESFES
jgi:prevent-host-death family protein